MFFKIFKTIWVSCIVGSNEMLKILIIVILRHIVSLFMSAINYICNNLKSILYVNEISFIGLGCVTTYRLWVNIIRV